MMSATLPDEPVKKEPEPVLETEHIETVDFVTTVDDETVKHEPKEPKVKEPIHVMQHRWSAQKRLKKVHVETLEKVYRKSKRPTVSNFCALEEKSSILLPTY